MATKSDQAAALQSSIALLQERFRQLQKLREMRKERELLQLLSEFHDRRTCSSFTSTMHYPPSSSFYSHEMTFPQKPSSALSLRPDSQMKRDNFQGLETAQDTKSWLSGTTSLLHTSPVIFDDSSSDVDTSLHL